MKKLLNYIEWHAALILFAFTTLAMNWKGPLWASIVVGIAGFALFLASCRSAFLYKSTALIDRYDERFFCKMTKERRGAARMLLGQPPESPDGPTGEDDLEDVLDFFEAPLAASLKDGTVSARRIYDVFYDWVRSYYQSPVAQKFLQDYQNWQPAAYTALRGLYGTLQEIERKEIISKTGKCAASNLKLSPEDLEKCLRKEAHLRK
jgi:hypothetical protein